MDDLCFTPDSEFKIESDCHGFEAPGNRVWKKTDAEFELDMEMIEILAQAEADDEQIHGQMDIFGRTILHS